MSVGKTLGIHLSGSNEGLAAVIIDEPSKASSSNDGESMMSKWEIIWLQMRRQSKFLRRMTAAMKDLVMMDDILRENGVHPESDERITFYPNKVKSGQMWHYWMNLCEALRSKDTSKWEAAIQEEYDSFMANGT